MSQTIEDWFNDKSIEDILWWQIESQKKLLDLMDNNKGENHGRK